MAVLPPDNAKTSWYRSRWRVLDGAVFGGFLLGLAVLTFYQGLSVAADRISVLFGVLASAGAMVVVTRNLHAGIKTDPGGVTVVPVIGRSRRLAWPDVCGFRLDEVPNIRHRAGWLTIYVIPRYGDHLHTSGCIFERSAKRSELARAQEVLRALEAERQRWTPEV